MALPLFPQPVPYSKRPLPPTSDDPKAGLESLARFLSREFGFVERSFGAVGQTPSRTVTSSVAATSADGVVLVDAATGPVTVTLPSALRFAGRRFVVKKVDASANAVTILPNGTDTIDGAASEALGAQWESVEVYALANGWSVLSQANILPPSGISGSGTATFLPIWTGPTTLASSVISQVAGAVTVGGALEVQGTFTRSGTGGFVVAPTTAGTINNVSIGVTTAAAGRFTTLEATGNVTLGDATTDTVTVNGRFVSALVPSTTNARDIGTSGLRWRDVYATNVDAVTGLFQTSGAASAPLIAINAGVGTLKVTRFAGGAIGGTTLDVEMASSGSAPVRLLTSTGVLNIVNGVNSGTEYQVAGTKVVGAQGAAVADPTGGTVQDSECRAQLIELLNRLRSATGHGLIV